MLNFDCENYYTNLSLKSNCIGVVVAVVVLAGIGKGHFELDVSELPLLESWARGLTSLVDSTLIFVFWRPAQLVWMEITLRYSNWKDFRMKRENFEVAITIIYLYIKICHLLYCDRENVLKWKFIVVYIINNALVVYCPTHMIFVLNFQVFY